MEYMSRALNLAARALRSSSPNPAVGAVLVKEGRVVGEGYTRPPGQAHAEIVALQQAGPEARGGALYVTLEPCPHQGRTPPCVEAIVSAEVAEVHMATIDPSPWVNGAGRAALEQAVLKTTVGLLERESRRLIEGYLHWVTRGRPLVTAIYGMSLDGAVAPDDVREHLGPEAQAELERLRSKADRVCAGLGSLLVEDPDLKKLGDAGVTSLLIECGASDLEQLVAAGLADKVIALVVPGLRPGSAGRSSSGAQPSEPVRLCDVSYERLGDDLMAIGYTRLCSPGS